MVRTYAFNASSRSEFFEQYKHTAATKFQPEVQNSTSRSQDTVPSTYSNDNRKFVSSDSQSISNSSVPSSMTNSSGNFENNNQFANHMFPPINQSSIYQSSFHSSMIDPIGSIVGLRLVYANGQLTYVPVEPHINLMINKQFGGQMMASGPQMMLPQIQPNLPVLAQNGVQNVQNVPMQMPQQQLIRRHSKQDVNENRQDQYQPPQSTLSSAKQQYRNNTMLAKFGSLPNLSQKPFLSSQEQHKLELQQQIEDNKRRRELEKQKELEMEQREIRKWEEYQKRIREEDEKERRQIQDKAKALELRNQQVYERQQIKAQNRKNERPQPQPRASENYQQYEEPQQYQRQQQPPQRYQEQQYKQQQYRQQQEYSDYSSYPEDEEPIRPAQNRNSNHYSEQSQRPPSRQMKNKPRYEQQQEVSREPRPDSSQPRKMEWWEKKPSWQERASDRQSAVIPTLRGKPPAVPDSQRSGYDSSGNVGEHQSRPSSRTTSSSQRSSDSQSEEPVRRHASGARKAPTAFTVEA